MPWWTFDSDVAYFIACIAIVILLALLALFITIVFNLYALDILYFEIVLNKNKNVAYFLASITSHSFFKRSYDAFSLS